MILVVGLSHKTAPVHLRERVAVGAGPLRQRIAALPQVREVAVLSTCNRIEIYACSADDDDDGADAARAIESVLLDIAGPDVAPELARQLFWYGGDAAVRHLFRVAASLDSLVVGEAQIVGQVHEAFDDAARAGTLGTMLGRVADGAYHVAKRVRSETQVGAGTVSVSSVAVELARQIFGDLAGRTTVLVGAGKMGVNAARSLHSAGANLLVINRNAQRAQDLAARYQGQARSWDQLATCLVEADVVITSTTSPEFVITRAQVSSLRRPRKGRSLFLIDIAVPRNIEPSVNALDGVYLYDIDDLSSIAAETLRERMAEAQLAERIVDEEAEAFARWNESLQVAPTIVALRNQVRKILEAELDRTLSGKLKHLGDDERKALEGMLNAAVNKLTHLPSTRLKYAVTTGQAGELAQNVRMLFGLELNQPARCSPVPSQPPCASHEAATTNGPTEDAP